MPVEPLPPPRRFHHRTMATERIWKRKFEFGWKDEKVAIFLTICP
jgi:hypothetical protein